MMAWLTAANRKLAGTPSRAGKLYKRARSKSTSGKRKNVETGDPEEHCKA
jgi:hypothetical protein